MTRKIPFSKLQRTCAACPSQWEMEFDDKCGCIINYHDDHLQVYISQSPVINIINCIDEVNLVLSVEDLLQTPLCGYMKDDVLFEILSAYDLLEKE
jgi:hypothetical protein